jgi:Asp/Glu/hydantoin racemase
MCQRFETLSDYASRFPGEGGSTAGILFTCSAFGPAIDAVKQRLSIPVLRPNEAAFEVALSQGDSIGLVVSFGPSLPSLTDELKTMASDLGRSVKINAVVAEGALAALKSGNGEQHDRLVADAVRDLGPVDVVILGQFSLARAHAAARSVSEVPVITTPDSAVALLRQLVTGEPAGAGILAHKPEVQTGNQQNAR